MRRINFRRKWDAEIFMSRKPSDDPSEFFEIGDRPSDMSEMEMGRAEFQGRGKWAIFSLIFILILAHVEAWGEDWKLCTQSNDGTAYYYDVARVTQVREGVLRFWGKAIPSAEAVKRFAKIDPKFKELNNIISLIEVSCTERKRKPLWIIFYGKDGVAIENVELTLDESDWEVVLPGSVQEAILDALCVGENK